MSTYRIELSLGLVRLFKNMQVDIFAAQPFELIMSKINMTNFFNLLDKLIH